MHLTITTHGDDIYNVEVDTQMTLEDLKALLETECGQPPERQILYFNGNQLNEAKKTLEQYEIKDYDMLLLQTSRAMPSSSALGGASDASHYEVMRQHVLSDPRLMEELARVQPAIAQAARNNPQEFATLMEQVDRTRRQAEQQRQDLLAASDNPFDVDAQKRIEEAIRQENIAANLEAAMEYNPESFARVTRLYVNVEINGTKLVALVDSGAQSTVISPETAERCDLIRLMDRRFAGVAKGVGTANILGRIHSAQMKLDNDLFLNCSFIVVEGKGSELLLGLDMLRNHQACIDLRKNALVFVNREIPFLNEHELPEKQRIMEVHGGGDDDMPTEARVVGPQAAHNAELPSASASGASASIGAVPATASAPTTTQTQPAQAPATTTTTTTSAFPEQHIQTLVSLGMSRPQAIQALEAANGNLDLAASLLF